MALSLQSSNLGLHSNFISFIGRPVCPTSQVLHRSLRCGCIYPAALREFDLDGNRFSGPIPDWLQTCFPGLYELDLSFNELTGPVPSWLFDIKTLREVKLEYNAVCSCSCVRGGLATPTCEAALRQAARHANKSESDVCK